MARRVFSKKDQTEGGRKQGPISKIKGLGIFSISPGSPEHIENCRKGGVTQGNIQGPANVASGLWEKIRTSPASVEGRLNWARSEENRERVREMGLVQGAKTDFSKIKTPESLRLGGVNSGGRHVRHHVNRKLLNPRCTLCQEARARHETWFTALYIPGMNGKPGKIKPLSEYENLTLEI